MEWMLICMAAVFVVHFLWHGIGSLRAWLLTREENKWRASVGMPEYKRERVHSTQL